MRSYKHYIRREPKNKYLVFAVVALILAVVLWVLFLASDTKQAYAPDIEIPMANAEISWSQSFRCGSWSDAG